MTRRDRYAYNMQVARNFTRELPMERLAVVQCGTWRGGACFGLVEAIPECKDFHMFDSFEGIPNPTERDGRKAIELFDGEILISKRNFADYHDVLSSIEHSVVHLLKNAPDFLDVDASAEEKARRRSMAAGPEQATAS